MSAQLGRAGRNLRSARQRLEIAMKAAEQAAISSYAEGVPETRIAEELNVNRMTVRRWLGKL